MSLLGLAVALLIGSAAPTDPAAFGTEMLQRLKQDYPAHRFQPADDPLSILRDKGSKEEEGTLNLHNVYAYCGSASSSECETSKAEWLRRVMLPPQIVTRESLRLMVRSADYVAFANDPSGTRAGGPPVVFSRQIGDDLRLLVASDAPDTIQSVGPKQAAALGMSEAEVWAVAEKNMQAILPALPDASAIRKKATAFEGVPYGSAMLARSDYWRKVAEESGGELFVTVVSDDFLLVGTLPDRSVTAFAPSVANDCAKAPRCISPHLYRFRGGQWRIADGS